MPLRGTVDAGVPCGSWGGENWSRRRGAIWQAICGQKKIEKGGCLPSARRARYFCINYPEFNPRFTLP